MTGQIKAIDNLDDRKQIKILLDKLTEKQRLAWLNQSLALSPANISNPGSVRATPNGKVGRYETMQFPWGSVEQVYFDFASAVTGFGLPMDLCLRNLELMVSRVGQRAVVLK